MDASLEKEISKYAVPTIGNRPKLMNDNNVKSIYFRETPTVIFINRSNRENGNIQKESLDTLIYRFQIQC